MEDENRLNQWRNEWGNATFSPQEAIFRNEEEHWRYIGDNATLFVLETTTSTDSHYQEAHRISMNNLDVTIPFPKATLWSAPHEGSITFDVEEVQQIYNNIDNTLSLSEVAAWVTSSEGPRATKPSFHDVQEPPPGIFSSTHLEWKKMTTMNREGV
ncbi:hypothetical protein O6H91_09G054200 [Diphasiastrum complanatum]|uniref:Uncharacterized protein n=1 Tax=Diphasiastrum complanatum TaxID=34168 RepID=A0ACC2CP76_DIPCM|nr:hypothetical protein O6H91_09G054200 [Diphasiastrum complanatum]